MTVNEYKIILFGSSCVLLGFLAVWYLYFVFKKNIAENPADSRVDRTQDHQVVKSVDTLSELIRSVNIFTDELESTVNELMRKAEAKEKRLQYLLSEADKAAAMLEKIRLERDVPPQVPAEEAPRVKHKLLSGSYGKVLELHGRGDSMEKISRSLSMDKGQVELICNLQKKLQ